MKSLLWNPNIVLKGNQLLSFFSRICLMVLRNVTVNSKCYFDEVFQPNELWVSMVTTDRQEIMLHLSNQGFKKSKRFANTPPIFDSWLLIDELPANAPRKSTWNSTRRFRGSKETSHTISIRLSRKVISGYGLTFISLFRWNLKFKYQFKRFVVFGYNLILI